MSGRGCLRASEDIIFGEKVLSLSMRIDSATIR